MVQHALIAGAELRGKGFCGFAERERERENEGAREKKGAIERGSPLLSPTVRDGCSTFYPNFPTLNTWTIKGHADP